MINVCSVQVTDVACGYGFTVFAVRTKEKYKLFGCGINTDSQIGRASFFKLASIDVTVTSK